jgi:ADP-heptose:LPS heptosyltransferase
MIFSVAKFLHSFRPLHYFTLFSLDIFFSFMRLLFRSNKLSQDKYLIIAIRNIGDSIFSLPALKQFFQAFDISKVTLIATKDNAPIYRRVFPDLHIELFEESWIDKRLLIAKRPGRKFLRRFDAGTIIDITRNRVTASMLLFAKAPAIAGDGKIYFRKIYTHFASFDPDAHLIDAVYIAMEKIFYVPPNERVRHFPAVIDSSKKIVIQSLAGWNAKKWGLRKSIQIAAKLKKHYPVVFVIQKGKLPADVLPEMQDAGIEAVETATVDELIAVIDKECGVMLSPDSGPLYIANLLGRPTFTIYGPTNPKHSIPFGKYHGFTRKLINCSPVAPQYCVEIGGLTCPSNECMQQLSVDAVYESFLLFLKRIGYGKVQEE